MSLMKWIRVPCWMAACLCTAPSWAFFLDGKGFYGMRGEFQNHPGASEQQGIYRAIDQTFRGEIEGRASEKSSLISEFRIFANPRAAYLGEAVQPNTCRGGNGKACENAGQSTTEPGYQMYTPTISKLYIRHAFDYCLLEAGRRERNWGMGLFLDSGNKPFNTTMSVFDGISCHVNMQKGQALGFSLGFDKLSQTQRNIIVPGSNDPVSVQGPTNKGGGLNQFYATLEYDDRETQLQSSVFAKQVGVYVARLQSASLGDGGSSTNLTFIDVYSGFYVGKFSLRSELLFRLGGSGDPHASRLGGAVQDENSVAVNNMQSIGGTAEVNWVLAQSGRQIGPEQYRQGDLTRHNIFTGITYAPGAAQGYYLVGSNGAIGDQNRGTSTQAMAFNQNFQPALIMFNGHPGTDSLYVDGIFDPTRIMNAAVYTLGYRYENLQYGNVDSRVIYAHMNEGMPSAVSTYYKGQAQKVMGYYGRSLGWELDVTYSIRLDKSVDWGLSAGYLQPGDAWQVNDSHKVVWNGLAQTHVVVHF